MYHDGIQNLVANLRTPRDKAGQSQYVLSRMSPPELLKVYKASPLARRIVDLPAVDACREWREWQAEGADITAIEAEEKRLNVQGKVKEAKRMARLMRGAAILIGTGDADPSLPLDPATVRRGGLRYLTVLGPDDISAHEFENDITAERYGQPRYWTGAGSAQRIHPSRLAVFHGIQPFVGVNYDHQDGWGESALTGTYDHVLAVDEVAANVLSLVFEAKVDVIKVPDLMANMSQRGDEYTNEVLRRMSLAATGKSINGVMLMDALEQYEQKNASFAGLPDILDRFMKLLSAASGIPMTLLFGQSAAGMNSTGEGDARNYYDAVKVVQSLEMQPAMTILDECIIRSALGDRPADLHYTWRPLWQPTSKERAETAKLLADTMTAVDGIQTLPREVLGKSIVNALTESGAFPGLEGHAAEYYAANGDDAEITPAEAGMIERQEGDE